VKRLIRFALIVAVLWAARNALQRWVDGPDPEPSGAPWPPIKQAQPDVGPEPVSWVEPNEAGEAPGTHPVKAKIKSGIYHLPGGAAYQRTRPDRCYLSPEAAEADGFHRSKR